MALTMSHVQIKHTANTEASNDSETNTKSPIPMGANGSRANRSLVSVQLKRQLQQTKHQLQLKLDGAQRELQDDTSSKVNTVSN